MDTNEHELARIARVGRPAGRPPFGDCREGSGGRRRGLSSLGYISVHSGCIERLRLAKRSARRRRKGFLQCRASDKVYVTHCKRRRKESLIKFVCVRWKLLIRDSLRRLLQHSGPDFVNRPVLQCRPPPYPTETRLASLLW